MRFLGYRRHGQSVATKWPEGFHEAATLELRERTDRGLVTAARDDCHRVLHPLRVGEAHTAGLWLRRKHIAEYSEERAKTLVLHTLCSNLSSLASAVILTAVADVKQLERLLAGVPDWNNWRTKRLAVSTSGSDLDPRRAGSSHSDLIGTGLLQVDLRGANFRGEKLPGANLYGADLRGADLCGSELSGANMIDARMRSARLRGSIVRGANLSGADLTGTSLRFAKLAGAILSGADLGHANLAGSNLGGAELWSTTLSFQENLQEADGLSNLRHLGPSSIDTNTLLAAGGALPEEFLVGIGLDP